MSGNFFDALGVEGVLGRTTSDAGAAVIGAQLWERVFAADPNVLGRIVAIDDEAVPIIGVADPAFADVFQSPADCWILMPTEHPAQLGVVFGGLNLFGVLPNDLTLAALQSRLAGHRFVLPDARERGDRLETVMGLEPNPDARQDTMERLAWLAMIVVLLLAVAFMALVDHLAADQSIRDGWQTVRLAIGATPGDVFRDNVSRHGLYAAAISLAGLLSFLYMSDVLLGMEPFAEAVGTLRLAASAVGIGAGTALLAATFLWSCWIVGRTVSRTTLVDAEASGAARGWPRVAWQGLLFVAAASLLVTLSIALGYAGQAGTLGFGNRDALMVGVIYSGGPSPGRSERVRAALLTSPHVRSAARAEMLPLVSESALPSNRAKARGFEGLEHAVFYRNRVDAAFFDVLDAELLAGSLFDHAANDLILSRSGVRRLGREVDEVLGLAIELAPTGMPTESGVFTVVGVVEDIAYGPVEEVPRALLYTTLPAASTVRRQQDFWLVRHAGHADDIVAMLRRLGGDVMEAYELGTPRNLLREAFERRSIEAVLAMAGAFAFVLGLAAVGNALGRSVRREARQIRIRFALGATAHDEALRIGSRALLDLLVIGCALAGLVVAGRLAAPGQAAIVTLPLLLVVLPTMAVACLAMSYISVCRLASRG